MLVIYLRRIFVIPQTTQKILYWIRQVACKSNSGYFSFPRKTIVFFSKNLIGY